MSGGETEQKMTSCEMMQNDWKKRQWSMKKIVLKLPMTCQMALMISVSDWKEFDIMILIFYLIDLFNLVHFHLI